MSEQDRTGHTAGHETFDELAVGWALHALEPEAETLFAAHLESCLRCVRTIAEATDVMRALATDLPPAEPGPRLHDRLRAEVERTAQLRPEVPLDLRAGPLPVGRRPPSSSAPPEVDPVPAPELDWPRAVGFPGYRFGRSGDDPRPAWRRVLPHALVAAAVAAMLGLGTWNVLLSTARDETAATAAEQSAVLDSLLQPGPATITALADPDGLDVATVVARDGQLLVVVRGLDVNDQRNTTYALWGMTDPDPVPLGTFDVVRSPLDLRVVRSTATGSDEYTGYAISIEPGRQTPSAPTEVVADGQVSN